MKQDGNHGGPTAEAARKRFVNLYSTKLTGAIKLGKDLIASKSTIDKVKYEQLSRTFDRYKKLLSDSGKLARKK